MHAGCWKPSKSALLASPLVGLTSGLVWNGASMSLMEAMTCGRRARLKGSPRLRLPACWYSLPLDVGGPAIGAFQSAGLTGFHTARRLPRSVSIKPTIPPACSRQK